MTQTIVFNQSDIETVQAIVSSSSETMKKVRKSGSKFFTIHSSLFTPKRIYRKQLKLYRRIAKLMDAHEKLTWALLWTQGIAFFYYIFMYY